MRMRAWVAAVAGASGAAAAHALDAGGRLPFVHEAVDVRSGLTAGQVLAWLALTALAAAAASYRITVLGLPVAVAASAAPELLARHDLGAVTEPGALLGAALQLPLLAAVVAVALLLERVLPAPLSLELPVPAVLRPAEAACSIAPVRTWFPSAPRAPPHVRSSTSS